MTGRQERQAAQKAKIAAMPLSKRIARLLLDTLAAATGAALILFVLSPGFDLQDTIGTVTIGTAALALSVYRYLIQPAQQHGEHEPT